MARTGMLGGPTMGALVWRGVKKRCPRCGEGKVFSGFFTTNEACSRCSYSFERESGYWVGAMIVNIAVAELWFALLLIATIIATAPDVAWQPLLVVALVTNVILPIVFYPHSKTLWMALDLYFHPDRPTPEAAIRS